MRANADLHRLSDAAEATERILAEVDMVEPAARRLDTYSKGMRQRVKIAAALVHQPSVLLLDEPFNGVDPRQRMHLMDLLRRLGDEGRTVLFSSHILEEVERLARHIEVVVSGRHAASGDFGAIRRLMTDRPVQYAVQSSDNRALGAVLMAQESVRAVSLRGDHLDVQVDDLGSFAVGLPGLARQHDVTLFEPLSQRRVAGERLRLPGGPMINVTIAKLALQALLGRRRFYLLLAFPVLLIGLVGLITALTDGDAAWEIVPGLGYTLVLPLVAILAASSVLGPEVDDGSIVYLLSKPVNRYGIAISKWLVALGATLVAGSLPIFVAALITGDSTRAVALFVGAVVAGTAYSALFIAISAVTRHAVIASLMFVLIWEGLLGNLFSGIAWLSISQWGIRIGHAISDELPDPANLPWAIGASLVVTLAGVWFAGDRLRSFSLRGED